MSNTDKAGAVPANKDGTHQSLIIRPEWLRLPKPGHRCPASGLCRSYLHTLVRDGKVRCGLRTPVETLFDGGDCDSKSLLLAAMIRSVDPKIGLSLVHCMNGEVPHMILAVGNDGQFAKFCAQNLAN